jgi:hypothetical protein
MWKTVCGRRCCVATARHDARHGAPAACRALRLRVRQTRVRPDRGRRVRAQSTGSCLAAEGDLPSDMVRGTGWKSPRHNMRGLAKLRQPSVRSTSNRFEVTNRQFRSSWARADTTTARFWTEPFEEGGKTLPWEAAMARFVDQGPAGPDRQAGRLVAMRKAMAMTRSPCQLVRSRRLRGVRGQTPPNARSPGSGPQTPTTATS